MCCRGKGCLGTIVKFLLGLLNLLFLILGSTIIVLISVLRWSNFNWSELIRNAIIQSVLNITMLNIVSFFLLGFGGLMVLLGIIGLIGVCCTNKGFLVFYEVILGALFVIHLSLFIFVVVKTIALGQRNRQDISDTVFSVNYRTSNWEHKCEFLKLYSTVFKCCGDKGPEDFYLTSDKEDCCNDYKSFSRGCRYSIRLYNKFFLIPNAILLSLELITFISFIFLIRHIGQGRRSLSSDN
jgi:hypothetical protein